MNRRAVLAATPALAFLPVSAGAEVYTTASGSARDQDTPILRLFRRHRKILNAAWVHECAGTGKAEDEELERLFYCHSDKIEAEMMALPCTCAADFAAKLIVDSGCGGMFSDWDTGRLWIEARELSGFDEPKATASASTGTTAAAGISKIEALYREWRAHRAWCNSPTGGGRLSESSGDWDRALAELERLEALLLREPATCAGDVILKFACGTSVGEEGLRPYINAEPFWREALSFAGQAAPAR